MCLLMVLIFELTVVMRLCLDPCSLAGVTKSCAYVCGRVASALTAHQH